MNQHNNNNKSVHINGSIQHSLGDASARTVDERNNINSQKTYPPSKHLSLNTTNTSKTKNNGKKEEMNKRNKRRRKRRKNR
jgi:hypothetical protein